MPKKVLVVEDYEDVRQMMIVMLATFGYEVIAAENGYEGVKLAVREKPDLILMDIAMPVLDGIGATQAIRRHADFSHIPILALTAFGDFCEDAALDAGCNEVIQKPVDFDRLQPLVEQYVHQFAESPAPSLAPTYGKDEIGIPSHQRTR